MPIRRALQSLGQAVQTVKKPGGTPTSIQNAKNWNAPGGGYDQWRKGDAAREKAMPIGSNLSSPLRPSPMSGGMARPASYKKGGVVKKTGMAKVHKGETVVPKGKLEKIGHELKVNPPKILAKTKRKSGARQANKQRVAILLSKARRG